MRNKLFFDLDGTLTDSSEGITKSAAKVLDTLGISYNPADLYKFIGPPIQTALRIFDVPDEEMEKGIQIFRDRYDTIGKFENIPYDGMIDALNELRENGYELYVATSKPEVIAREILEKFGMLDLFIDICGASPDRTRASKNQVIQHLLDNGISPEEVIMIGDTMYDVLGAKEFGIPCIVVTWGFGEYEELKSITSATAANTTEMIEKIKNIL
ncbi:MAG: HAD-IA family hydrolase [Pseudobutyrivibrio sp.]|nr:HAD-IA family hydrolase [Pseudobutyrivibrio sp.]